MLNLDYPNILALFSEHLDPKRTESASFLIWYLENYYRLDTLAAVDSVCDQHGDKGIDGIYVNDNDMTITIFQCRIAQSRDKTIGDASLREFCGTLSQFKDQSSVQTIIATGGDAEVVRLIRSLDLVNKVNTHELRGEFVTNIDIDANGTAFLATTPQITFLGRTDLIGSYVSNERTPPMRSPCKFDLTGFQTTDYVVDAKVKAIIAPVKAKELVALQGIADQTLFAFNVRGPLGRTQVNRDIIKSIRDPNTHKLFPLFHNGIIIICQRLDCEQDRIEIDGYYVVNGCQSLNSLYGNRTSLTDNLRILTKFIKMDVDSPLSEMVTRYSNNQNGVKARDFKANNPIQIRLQNDFRKHYASQYAFEIKRGETPGSGTVISNEEAGLYLMSFDLKEPWATHRKYQVFEEKHADLFARPEVTADRIVLCQVIAEAIQEAMPAVKNTLFAKYLLTRYLILYIIRLVLESEDVSDAILTAPESFVRAANDRDRFKACVKRIVNDVVVDINADVDEHGEDFDYRGKLRDSEWVKGLSRRVSGEYRKLVNRGRIDSFSAEWKRLQSGG
jgi:hypothetical protein